MRLPPLALAACAVASCAGHRLPANLHNPLELLDVTRIDTSSLTASSSSPHRHLAVGASVGFSASRVDQGASVVVTASAPAVVADPLAAYAWVGVWSPPDSNVSTSTPVRFQMCVVDPAWLVNGTCAIDMRLNNLHTGGYVAYLILGGLTGPGSYPGSDVTGSPSFPATTVTGGWKPWTSPTA